MAVFSLQPPRVEDDIFRSLFGGAVGKDTVSRAWHKVQADWQAWQKRDLANDDIVRLILDGTAVQVRVGQRATRLSVLVALGVRRDSQKVLLPCATWAAKAKRLGGRCWMTRWLVAWRCRSC
jgi:transposase-like protein